MIEVCIKKGAETNLVWGGEECASGSKSKTVRRLFLREEHDLNSQAGKGEKSVYG